MTSSTAAQFQPDALTRLVLNLDLTFHWIEGGDRFWFKREARAGHDFVIVDAATGRQSVCAECPTLGAKESPCVDRVMSPDGRLAVHRQESDLWLRDVSSGAESRLTHDGEAHFAYGDIDPSYDREGVARRRAGRPRPLLGALWSPDSRFVLALRQDLRSLPERLFVTEYVPADGGYSHAHFRRVSVAADAKAPDSQLVIFDTRTSSVRKVSVDPQGLNDLALHYLTEGIVWWTSGGTDLFMLTANRGGSRVALNCVDLMSGQSREVLHECASFNVRLNPFDYARPNVFVTSDGREVIWYSESSGYGHLYLHDARSGDVKRAITTGEWVVFDLLRVDELRRLIYFTAATRSEKGNPYYRYLYCVSFDGGVPVLLTPECADHKFSNLFFYGAQRMSPNPFAPPVSGSSISPSGSYFVDSYSTTGQAPEYVVRRISGEWVTNLLSSDASALYAAGWQPPERFVVKAADGITDLYGVITRPRRFDPAGKYPVIDSMYPGPQGSFAPRTFADQLAGGSIHHLQTFADAGFIVVALDGRGTAHRSRSFRDSFLGTEDVFGTADHVAAIKNLGLERPYMDLERVGVRGQSFGGYGSLRALLLFPEFFKVAVSATGPAGYLEAEGQTNVERFFGVPAESARSLRHYDTVSNTRLVPRLKGRVLLIYGGVDESVPLQQAFTLLDALIKADKDFDLLVVPDSAHAVAKDPYVIRRSVDYFIAHLAEAQ